MRDIPPMPDLTFPNVKLGARETPWDLRRWLYHGGASVALDKVAAAIDSHQLGEPLPERIKLMQRIHDSISDKLAGGGSKATAASQTYALNWLIRWAEANNRPLTYETIQTTYIEWTDAQFHRVNVLRDLKQRSAHSRAVHAGRVLDLALERTTPMIEITRLRRPKVRKTARGVQADKQNLEQTFAFGHLMQDICDGLPLSALWGPLPVRISLHDGGELLRWSGRKAVDLLRHKTDTYNQRYRLKEIQARLAAFEADRTLRTRFPLANLRIQAELMMFIGQTGMNMGQAHQLRLRHFSYSSDVDGYKVMDYKTRRGGEVLFVIYKQYRAHFERYLEWRQSVFPDETLLFPLVRQGRAEDKAPNLYSLVMACSEAGVRWVSPQKLRNARVNWLLRRSGDLDLTAELAQHSKQTLLRDYEVPSQQRAIGEITRFWLQADPTLNASVPQVPIAPGACSGSPSVVPFKPKVAVAPDCIHPSGCLWCEHHRDIDALDYIWSLACFRHLKILEVGRYHPPTGRVPKQPGEYAIERMSDKLTWFLESNAQRREWVEESLARVDEGNYHPDWARLIQDMEGVAP